MQFSEDDLRSALKPKDPGPEFTQRVMARLGEADARSKGSKNATAPQRRPWHFWFAGLKLGPALAAAVAVLLMVGAWVGYQGYQRHQQEVKNAQQHEMEAKRAEQQAILALRITSEKLNHVFQKVNGAAPPEDKIRRQRL